MQRSVGISGLGAGNFVPTKWIPMLEGERQPWTENEREKMALNGRCGQFSDGTDRGVGDEIIIM